MLRNRFVTCENASAAAQIIDNLNGKRWKDGEIVMSVAYKKSPEERDEEEKQRQVSVSKQRQVHVNRRGISESNDR